MRWYQTLVVGQPYFVTGFVDRKFTVPAIGTFVYLGVGTLGTQTKGLHCFQDARTSDLADPDDRQEPSYLTLPEEALDMIADGQGLIAWLQSLESAPSSTTPTDMKT
jgi:hypothetical protein